MPQMQTFKDIHTIIQGMKMHEFTVFDTSYIPIYNRNGDYIGKLVPVDQKLAESDDMIAKLVKWRSKFMKFFMTQFRATEERTRAWLKNTVIPDHTRILFVILEDKGNIVGNFGVCNISSKAAELDNLIRGEKGGDQQLIYFAEISLMDWFFSILGIDRIYLHVFSNNSRTISLHKSVGFNVNCAYELTKTSKEVEIRYIVGKTVKQQQNYLQLLEMEMYKSDFYKHYHYLTRISK